MPYFRGQAVGDDYLQGELARYRAQNPGAAADDQSILDVLEGRAQPNWETRGQFAGQAPPQQAPGFGLPPGVVPQPPGGWQPPMYQTMGGGGYGGGMMPLSSMGGGGMGMVGGYGYGQRPPQWKPSAPGGMYAGGGYGMPQQGQMMPLSQMGYPQYRY